MTYMPSFARSFGSARTSGSMVGMSMMAMLMVTMSNPEEPFLFHHCQSRIPYKYLPHSNQPPSSFPEVETQKANIPTKPEKK